MYKYNSFFREKVTKMFVEKPSVIDIGGSLKIDAKRNNRAARNEWILPLVKDYKVLDKVPDYNPDIVGDIHDLPLADESVEALFCIDILEHVEEPQKACKEMFRVLKKGGYLMVKVPFIFYYHPEKGYYEDFYRFTRDGLKYMLRDFSHVEIQKERGAISTLFNLIPFFTKRTKLFDWLDLITGKDLSEQTSGYCVFCIK